MSVCQLMPVLSTRAPAERQRRMSGWPASAEMAQSQVPPDFTNLHAARQRRPQADSHAVPAEPAASQLRMEVCPELTSYDHRRAHFLAMCMKLVYERPACIEDIAQSR